MIVFNLRCKDCTFEFEGWFDNSSEFEKQKKRGIVNCPSCDKTSITKTLMAPNLSKKTNSRKNIKNNSTLVNQISKYKKVIENSFDYVGGNFAEEAKKMKYGEIIERPIYGEANLEQTKELIEEDIKITPLPWMSSKKSN